MATATVTARPTYQPRRLEDLLQHPCGCGALAWYSAPCGRIGCAECGAWLFRPCGLPPAVSGA